MRKLALIFGLLIPAPAALAQQTLPPNTVSGRLGVSPGPPQAIPFATLQSLIGGGGGTSTLAHTHIFVGNGSNVATDFAALATFSDTGSMALTPTAGPGLTINTAPGATQGILNNQTGNNSGTIGSTNYSYNPWTVTNDGLAATTFNAVTSGLSMVMSTGGSNSGGTKVGIYSLLSHNNSSSPLAARDHIAAQSTCISSVSDGGTNTAAGSQGTCFGGNSSSALLSGATNHTEVAGWECDSAINTGASAKMRVGCGAIGLGNLTGATVDAAFEIGAVSTSWLVGLVLNDNHGAQAIATTGSVITSNNSTNTGQSAVTLANFANLPSINFTGNLFNFAHLVVTGAGAITANNYGLGLIHSSAGGVFTSSAVSLTADVTGTLPIAGGGTNDTGTAYATYTPTVGCTTGAATTITAAGRFKTLGKTVWFEIFVTDTTNGTCATAITFTLPVAAAAQNSFVNSNPNTTVAGHCFVAGTGGTVLTCTTYNAVYPLTTGQNLYISGVYEST